MLAFTPRNFLILTIVSHLALLGVLFFGSWVQILAMVLMGVFNIVVASTVTYHRLLSHRSFDAPRWFEVFGTILGIFSFTGTPITRVLMHRYHHKYADEPLDPHSPKQLGIFGAYFPMLKEDRKFNVRLVGEMLSDPLMMFIHRYYIHIVLTTLALCVLVVGPMWAGALLLGPGAMCWMNISLCNILCHIDGIKDSKLLAYLTFGEGWHKFHHDNPNVADFGQGKWDPGYWIIKLVQKKPTVDDPY